MAENNGMPKSGDTLRVLLNKFTSWIKSLRSDLSDIEGKQSTIEGKQSTIEGKQSTIEGKQSTIESKMGRLRELKTITVQIPTNTIQPNGTVSVPANLSDMDGHIVGATPYVGGGAGALIFVGFGGTGATMNLSFRNVSTMALTPNANTRFYVTYRVKV